MTTVGQAVGAPLAGLLIEYTGATTAFLAFTLIGALATPRSPTMHSQRE